VVDMLATSEISVSMTLPNGANLEPALPELEAMGDCQLVAGKTLLCVVGQHMPRRAGLASTVLGAIARAGVNVEMLSYAVGSINFSMLIDNAVVRDVVPVLHQLLLAEDPNGDAGEPAAGQRDGT